MSSTLNKITCLLFLLLLGAVVMFGQADESSSPYDVNGSTTKVPTEWYETPFLWLGLVVFVLVGVLLYLRKGKSATTGKLHKY